jgi:hypothetical protein
MSSMPPEGAGIVKADLALKPVFMGFLIGTRLPFCWYSDIWPSKAAAILAKLQETGETFGR